MLVCWLEEIYKRLEWMPSLKSMGLPDFAGRHAGVGDADPKAVGRVVAAGGAAGAPILTRVAQDLHLGSHTSFTGFQTFSFENH